MTKRYGDRVAVDPLDFELPQGVVAGFIGPNGAETTTTMVMLLGLVKPGGGTGTVLGHPLDAPAKYLPRVGALIEGPAIYPGLTGTENLRVLAATEMNIHRCFTEPTPGAVPLRALLLAGGTKRQDSYRAAARWGANS